jgi:hypothetical protein
MQVTAAGVAGAASCQALTAPTLPRLLIPCRAPRAPSLLSSGAGEAAAPLLLLVPGQVPSTMDGAAAAAMLRHLPGPTPGAMDGAALSPRHRRRHRASPLGAVSEMCSYLMLPFHWLLRRCSVVMYEAKCLSCLKLNLHESAATEAAMVGVNHICCCSSVPPKHIR